MATVLPGLPSTGYAAAYGGIPSVSDPLSTAAAAGAGNIKNLSGFEDLAAQVNKFNIGQAAQPYIMGLPNYQGMVDQSSKNITSLLAGKVPADVLAQISQSAAERGIGIGSAGSDNVNAAMLRALGLTSLGLMEKGESELTGAMARTPTAKLFDPSSYFVSPDEMQKAQSAANIYAAAPVPSAADAAARAAAKAGAAAAPAFSTPGISPVGYSPTRTGTAEPGTYVGRADVSDLTAARDPLAAWNEWYSGLPRGTATGDSGLNMGENVGEGSSTWNLLADYGIDPTGWTREDVANLFGVDPAELDLGTPAGYGEEDYAGSYEDYFGDFTSDFGG